MASNYVGIDSHFLQMAKLRLQQVKGVARTQIYEVVESGFESRTA